MVDGPKKQGAARIFGHKSAVQSVRDITEGCAELGIEYLTLYAFSTENWSRPKAEVAGLMRLLVNTIRKELRTLLKNNVRLTTIGNLATLPNDCQVGLKEAMEATKNNDGLLLILALSYSGRWEILEAVNAIAEDIRHGKLKTEKIDEALFESYLNTSQIPDPELLIRTSGEMRLSNFLLWQIAYTELYITKKFWPDFRKSDLLDALVAYQKRERRFGKISEQVKT